MMILKIHDKYDSFYNRTASQIDSYIGLKSYLEDYNYQIFMYFFSLSVFIHSALRIGYNSLCAYASVNHLHMHAYYVHHRLPAQYWVRQIQLKPALITTKKNETKI